MAIFVFAIPTVWKVVTIAGGALIAKITYDLYQESKIEEERRQSNRIKAENAEITRKFVNNSKQQLIQNENKRREIENNYIDKKINESHELQSKHKQDRK